MARIRTVKPEFTASESMGNLSRDARLMFILLWTICDDEGRSRAHPRMLANSLFPYDPDAVQLIDGWLAELEREKCIVLYEHDGKHFLQVLNWSKHQRVDKPYPSKIPPFQESFAKNAGTFANVRESDRNVTSRNGMEIERKGSEDARAGEEKKPEPDPTHAGLACKALIAAGVAHVNPSHPNLLAALAEGATPTEIEATARECVAKGKHGFPYVIEVVRKRRAETAAPVKPPEPRRREAHRAGSTKPRGDPARLGDHLGEIAARLGIGAGHEEGRGDSTLPGV